ncbi:MAG: hypothetical protein D6746_08110 [Bacteroidetes bacterium]|nr:MAG: hypothetical protein D6746_08110 [Bacteroidota bacterium]
MILPFFLQIIKILLLVLSNKALCNFHLLCYITSASQRPRSGGLISCSDFLLLKLKLSTGT